jgi:peptide/nickel transport system permease protein
MLSFLARRAVFFLFTLLLTSLLVFALTRILPGDPARVIAGGRDAPQERVEAVRQELGLDDPLPVQYLRWGMDFLRGDWGTSSAVRGVENRAVIGQRLENSGRLALVTLVLAVPLSLFLGVLSGLMAGKWPDVLISLLTLAVVSLPEFVTGLFLINTVALKWADNPLAERFGWFPASSAMAMEVNFWQSLPSLWLPAVSATFVLLAYIARLTRAGIIEETGKDYLRTARLKGLPAWRVFTFHLLRNALLPVVTVIALSTTWLLSGLVTIEYVFGYPGVGSLLVLAIERRDLPLVQALVMVTVVIVSLANLIADILYAALNPRIRLH